MYYQLTALSPYNLEANDLPSTIPLWHVQTRSLGLTHLVHERWEQLFFVSIISLVNQTCIRDTWEWSTAQKMKTSQFSESDMHQWHPGMVHIYRCVYGITKPHVSHVHACSHYDILPSSLMGFVDEPHGFFESSCSCCLKFILQLLLQCHTEWMSALISV